MIPGSDAEPNARPPHSTEADPKSESSSPPAASPPAADAVEESLTPDPNDTALRGTTGESLNDLQEGEAVTTASNNPLNAPQARRALLAQLRYDMRTPVSAVLGYTQFLLEDCEQQTWAEFKDDLEKIHRAGERLLGLIDQILNPANADTFDAEKLGSHVRHELRTPLNHIIGYSEMLLEDAEAEEGLENFVSDLQKINKSGHQALASIDDLLKLSQLQVGDDVDVQSSEYSDVIRTVMMSLTPISPEANADRSKGQVLVVDDNETNRDMLARQLARQGHEVEKAIHGADALEKLTTNSYDVVLLDIMMPGVNGIQVLQYLKADSELKHVPVIMISALDELDSVVRCIEMGAEDYLPKPFNSTLLKARLGACLEKKRLRDREVMFRRQIEKEKQRSEDLLHVIFPPEIVAELKRTNEVKPRRYEDVAVLFSDIVGFTPYCERHEPEEVVNSLQELVVAYEEFALEHDLQKIKTIGDAFMAASGLLKDVENPVLACVRCGLKMIEATKALPVGWNIRIGVHVGPVVAGILGRRQYLFDLWGDTVNTAARMESHGTPGSVTMSRDAWGRIKHLSVGESQGSINVKGKGDYEVFRFDHFRQDALAKTD